MTRELLDSLHPDDIPADTPVAVLIAAYLGHADNPESYAQACARFPAHQIVSIASHNAVNAQILDVEHRAVEPTDYATINDWCNRQIARGVTPTIYCNTSTWPNVAPHVHETVNWWAANWSHGPTIPPGAVGVQYSGVPGYDISVMADFIEGIDMALVPSDEPVIAAGALSAELTPYGVNTPEPALQWIADMRVLVLNAIGDLSTKLDALEVAVGKLTPGTVTAAPSYTGTLELTPTPPTP